MSGMIPAVNPDSVDELLRAMARALTSDEGREAFHRLAAAHEAAVHDGLVRSLDVETC